MKSIFLLLLSAGIVFAGDPEDFFEIKDRSLTSKTSKFYRESPGSDGVLTLTRTENYKDGSLISVIVISGDEKNSSHYECDRDEKGRPRERRQLDATQKLYGKFVYSYAEDGSWKTKTFRCDADGKEIPGTVVEYAYDASGRWLSAEQVQPTGLVRRRDNEYDDSGKLIKSILSSTLNVTKEVDEMTTYSYDAQNRLTEAATNSGDGRPMDKTTFNIQGDAVGFVQYDELGNVAQRVEITPEYKAGDKRVSEVWKVFLGEEKVPRVSGRSTFEYEYVK